MAFTPNTNQLTARRVRKLGSSRCARCSPLTRGSRHMTTATAKSRSRIGTPPVYHGLDSPPSLAKATEGKTKTASAVRYERTYVMEFLLFVRVNDFKRRLHLHYILVNKGMLLTYVHCECIFKDKSAYFCYTVCIMKAPFLLLITVFYNLLFSRSSRDGLGYLIHSAPWRKKFGVRGSHGRVNVTTANMEKLYAWASEKTFIHIF